VKLTLVTGGSQASYQVQEQLAGKSLPSAAIGRTSAVSGAVVLDAAGKIVPAQSKFTIDLRTLRSDQGMRDNYIQHDPRHDEAGHLGRDGNLYAQQGHRKRHDALHVQ
jgi:hypothetical protein